VGRVVQVQLQEESISGGGGGSIVRRLLEEGESLREGQAAVKQLQPRPVFLQIMTQVLQLAHAAAAVGAISCIFTFPAAV
jgi:hypothetical protein